MAVALLVDASGTSPAASSESDAAEQLGDEMQSLWKCVLVLSVTSHGVESESSKEFRLNGQIPVAAKPEMFLVVAASGKKWLQFLGYPGWLFIYDPIAESTKRLNEPTRPHPEVEDGENSSEEAVGELCNSLCRSLQLAGIEDFRNCQEETFTISRRFSKFLQNVFKYQQLFPLHQTGFIPCPYKTYRCTLKEMVMKGFP
jgi:hypothetical protein